MAYSSSEACWCVTASRFKCSISLCLSCRTIRAFIFRSLLGRLAQYPYEVKTFGYARVSTDDQDLRHQIKALKEYGCSRIFEEKQSGKNMKRKQFELMRVFLHPGDTLVVTKLDRLGRNLVELEQFIGWLEKEQIELVCLHQPVDLKSAMGRMIMRQMAVFAQMESELASERTKFGLEAARAAGKQVGAITKRERWEAKEPDKAAAILKDIADPAQSIRAIAKKYEVTQITLRNNWTAELNSAGKLKK